MKTYARIDAAAVVEFFETDGDIADMFHPDLVWVDVTAASPVPSLGWSATETNGKWTFAAAAAPVVTPQMAALAALAAGISIVSTGTPALNATYACDSLTQSDIVAIETSLNAGKGFPGGGGSFNYPDAAGVMHTFSESNFSNFAAAVRDYVYALKSVMSGASSTLPAASTTIA
ncbi:hypothetical protein LFL96_21280 [Paraburkholderia sp. D15]|uniref:hypothetical protein n=1 Tax=Paraburkholderia sp. D15 TaxID=2880218 RepID=UPI00247A96A3|nr:hypothetical protein [Paraburkholderia sp. D15]WGS53593.1 hypothetical protein LFL96_21280 [Paraburkholderia sp. D15]